VLSTIVSLQIVEKKYYNFEERLKHRFSVKLSLWLTSKSSTSDDYLLKVEKTILNQEEFGGTELSMRLKK